MDLLLDGEALGLPLGDPVDVALMLLEKEEPFWITLFDIGEAQFFDGQNLSSVTFVLSGLAFKVFKEIGLNCREPNKDEKEKKGMKPIDLLNFVSQISWVCDPYQIVRPTPGNKRSRFFLSKKMPQRPDIFCHILEVILLDSQPEVKIIVDGLEDPRRISYLDTRRFEANLTRLIDEGIKKDKIGPTIIIPDTQNGFTTLQKEIAWLKSLLQFKMATYNPPQESSIKKQIVRILANHCDESVAIDISNEESRLRKLVRASIEAKKTIPISITIAHGLKVPQSLKNKDRFGPPTFAWLYNIFEFALMNLEVKKIWPPGLTFYLFEEGPLFHEMLGVGWEIVERNLRITQRLIDELEVPALILPLLPEYFPAEKVAKTSISSPTDEEIFSMVCSLEEMQDREVMDLLYVTSKKDFAWIRQRVGRELWQKAWELAKAKNMMLKYCKDVGLFFQLIKEKTGENVENRLLDGAVTEKEGRFCFKLTRLALFNHGSAIVERNKCGRLACWVVPEYRLEDGLFRIQEKVLPVRPIRINLTDFGESGNPYIWCYEVYQRNNS